MKNKILLISVLLLALPTVNSLFRPGFFPMHDDLQAMRLLQMEKCITDGQIPCRWVPDMGYGYGYPQFNFYGPFPYYLSYLFRPLGLSILASIKAGFVLSTLVAGAGMFILVNNLFGPAAGFLGALLYLYAPYRAVDFYVRGAFSELWALSLFPWIFWSIKQVVEHRKYAELWLAFSLGALLTTHNISSLMLAPFAITWAAVLLFQDKKHFKAVLFRLGLSGVWGVGLSAFYILPAWFEKQYVHTETLLMGYFDYRRHFASIAQLLFQTFWGYGTSQLGIYDGMNLSVGILIWVLAYTSAFCFVLYKSRANLLVLYLLFIGVMSLFMSHGRSSYIWDNLPLIHYFQFPWRFLAPATFFLVLSASSIVLHFNHKKYLIFALTGLIFLLYSHYFSPQSWIDINDQEKFSGENWRLQQTISIYDYLPVFAKAPPGERAPKTLIPITGEILVNQKSSGTDWQRYEIDVISQRVLVQIPQFYFPGWKVLVNGTNYPISFENELGLMQLELKQGSYTIEAKLTNTPVRSSGNLISLAAFLFVPIYLYKHKNL